VIFAIALFIVRLCCLFGYVYRGEYRVSMPAPTVPIGLRCDTSTSNSRFKLYTHALHDSKLTNNAFLYYISNLAYTANKIAYMSLWQINGGQ